MEIQDKIKQYLGEDATDQEKHNKLNDIFSSLERLNDEVYELEYLDAKEGSSGVGDLNDQLVTFRKLIKGLYSVLDRASGVVPKEAQEGEVNEYRMSYGDADKLGRENASKIDNILRRKVADMGKDIRDVMPGDLDEMRYEIAKEMGLVESKLTEGYESKVISICKDAGIDCSFKDGKMYVAKEDMAKAKKALEDNEDILELPDMVAENAELDRLKYLIGVDTIREMKQ